MVPINCESEKTAKLTELVPFQGKLKRRTDAELTSLARSLTQEGLMAPFFVWEHDGKKYLLDGHGRLEALTRISMLDPTVLEQEWPVVVVHAEDEAGARKALLQIVSSYGKLTKPGLKQFTATIPDYKLAPVVTKFQASKPRVRAQDNPYVTLRIRVLKENEEQVRKILRSCPAIEVV